MLVMREKVVGIILLPRPNNQNPEIGAPQRSHEMALRHIRLAPTVGDIDLDALVGKFLLTRESPHHGN